MKLSIIIPVFNEEKTIGEVLRRVEAVKIPDISKEIIVVDDGSTDETAARILRSNFFRKIIFLKHEKNFGKGKAVRTGIKRASGDYVLIQDADLEYNPKDIEKLFEPIKNKETDVVYGTRLNRLPDFKKDERTLQFLVHYFGNRMLSLLTSILYGQWITDMETGYKLIPKSSLDKITLYARGFEFEPEITAKLLKKRYKILEVPISTNPRGYDEGKKLNPLRDGLIALFSLIKYKFID